MAHLPLPVHAASFVISTTSSPAAKKGDRPLLSFFRWIAADFIVSLMNIHSVEPTVQIGFVWQLSQQ